MEKQDIHLMMENDEVNRKEKEVSGERKRKKEKIRPRRESNPQSSDPKSDALSIRPRGRAQV